MTRLASLAGAVGRAPLTRRLGVVRELRGLAIEAEGPRTEIGELCAIVPPGQRWAVGPEALPGEALGGEPGAAGAAVLAEVVGIAASAVTLMPYGDVHGLTSGSTVVALGSRATIGVGEGLVGRVIDAFGRPLDGAGPPRLTGARPLRGAPANPMERPRIARVLETGIRSIDALLTVGQGQRVGIFAGSGVGKSTLLGMIARHVRADVNVVALIGERGREVREFVEEQLGPEGLKRSVVVAATADQPALARVRAAHAALAIASWFREQRQQVLLTMDSITRYAMARREIGLSAGEPPTARGYTPSVFAELPQLCERCGTAASGGSITALLTVLVEGDDLNEPISDALRAILDGHVVLARHLAHQGQYPAIDVLRSASRLLPDLATPEERALVERAIRTLAVLDRNRQMVELGAYERGSNPELDAALACQEPLQRWLRQVDGGASRPDALGALAQALEPATRGAEPAGAPRSSLASAGRGPATPGPAPAARSGGQRAGPSAAAQPARAGGGAR